MASSVIHTSVSPHDSFTAVKHDDTGLVVIRVGVGNSLGFTDYATFQNFMRTVVEAEALFECGDPDDDANEEVLP